MEISSPRSGGAQRALEMRALAPPRLLVSAFLMLAPAPPAARGTERERGRNGPVRAGYRPVLEHTGVAHARQADLNQAALGGCRPD